MPHCEPDTIALVIPAAIGPGPHTLIKARFCDAAEVIFPVNLTTAAQMLADWEGVAMKRPDPRGETKDAIITAFQRGEHGSAAGARIIAAAALYLVWTGNGPAEVGRAIERGGATLTANVTSEGGALYRFRLMVE